MKTSTLLLIAAGVGAVVLVAVMARNPGAFTAARPAPAPVAARPKQSLASQFDPTSSTSAFGAEVRDLLHTGLDSLFGP